MINWLESLGLFSFFLVLLVERFGGVVVVLFICFLRVVIGVVGIVIVMFWGVWVMVGCLVFFVLIVEEWICLLVMYCFVVFVLVVFEIIGCCGVKMLEVLGRFVVIWVVSFLEWLVVCGVFMFGICGLLIVVVFSFIGRLDCYWCLLLVVGIGLILVVFGLMGSWNFGILGLVIVCDFVIIFGWIGCFGNVVLFFWLEVVVDFRVLISCFGKVLFVWLELVLFVVNGNFVLVLFICLVFVSYVVLLFFWNNLLLNMVLSC